MQSVDDGALGPLSDSSSLSQYQFTDQTQKTLIGKLHIVAVEGRNLAIKDITGSSDPYIIFKTNTTMLKTTTVLLN
jgi:Ca2+-dependent lipid-binding protein